MRQQLRKVEYHGQIWYEVIEINYVEFRQMEAYGERNSEQTRHHHRQLDGQNTSEGNSLR